jgi:hypothetical protein
MATYFSTDGGTTWTTVFIDETQDGQGTNDTRFDPNVAFDSDARLRCLQRQHRYYVPLDAR